MARAVVIGGGVGGLAAGAALRRKGWEVTVLERAPVIEPVGSGLAIAANALKALDVIGVGDRVRELATVEGRFGLRRSDGRWLTHTTEAVADAKYGDSVVLMSRATLMEVLMDAFGREHLHLGTTVTEVDPDKGLVRTDAGDLDADLVVGADGINSAVRRTLFPAHPGPVYSGVTAWRGLVPRGGLEIPRSESWGRGTVFGIHLLAGDVVYFYATDVLPAGTVHADERAELLRRFGDWHDPIPALLRAADPARIIRNDVHYNAEPLPAFHRGSVALVGDAAHAMTPNLGQGACQAIEDGVVLAHHAGHHAGHASGGALPGGALAAYSAARVERTAKIVQRSWTLCRMSKLRNPLAVGLRDFGLSAAARLSPDLMLRSMDEVLGWRPPAEAGR
ncbi:FAD-dependent monooxygenase [Nonomuraea rubra]|uniref:2-polyprenyl-6-methoxyphenol hydroxylase-like FAD-dependent oxidoreductase n=1 Tax=Nonomuraea rubra TaxID=46180 RepID=A0A7X0TWS2_9ACTN|nr:FAD-dependent monooxygenase [Nonomuraea rubra]MBB6546676.1 2-polyprenyl-6-methoxyphenol hydroxylase-like FAD-dependent oxidoreductase [Nonomuraea rubra]